jgi:hypothetical protein
VVYSPTIRQSPISESEKRQSLISVLEAGAQKELTSYSQFKLSWTHYHVLMRVDNGKARRFYEIEAASQQWTVNQFKRQVGSSLYERLALSRDKDKLSLEQGTLRCRGVPLFS